MLVSSIARFSAVNTMDNSALTSNQTSNSRVNAVHAFSGDKSFGVLNVIDKKLNFKTLAGQILHKITNFQEKVSASKHFNTLA